MSSQTGPIRKRVGPAKKRVQDKIRLAKEVLDQDLPDSADELEDMHDDVSSTKAELLSSTKRYSEHHKERQDAWQDIALNIADEEERNEEIERYEGVCDEYTALQPSAQKSAIRKTSCPE